MDDSQPTLLIKYISLISYTFDEYIYILTSIISFFIFQMFLAKIYKYYFIFL